MDNYLDSCKELKSETYCDKIYLSQILPLTKRKQGTCTYTPVTLPTREIRQLCRLFHARRENYLRFKTFSLLSKKETREAGITYDILKTELAQFLSEQNNSNKESISEEETSEGESSTIKPTTKVEDNVIERAKERLKQVREQYIARSELPQAFSRKSGYSKVPNPRQPDILNNYRDIISDIPIHHSVEAKPALGFQVTYEQEWCLEGYKRGRLIRSISLPADGRKEISIKSWAIRKERREENESVENDISTEIVGDEKWSHATTKKLSAELNQTIDANLKANGEIPLKGAKVGVGGGAGSNTSGAVSGSITDTVERVHQATIKVTDSLKKKASTIIETSEELGLETTVTQTIVNPNKCNTLTYHFFEVIEVYHVKTKVDSLSPIVLIALPSPSFTPEWILCHECLIKKHLPCENYYAGFEAAKAILSRKELGEFLGSLEGEEVQQIANASLDRVEAVVAAYLSLKNANIVGLGQNVTDSNVLDQAVDGLLDLVNEFGNKIDDFVEGVVEETSEFVEDVINTGREVIEGVAQTIGGFFGNLSFSQPLMASGGNIAFSVAHTPGGIGSYIYWQVAEIVAPELGSALSGLESAYEQIVAMSDSAAQTNALQGALKTFFTSLGNVDEVFRKIDMGLSVIAGGLALSTASAAVAFVSTVGVVGGAIAAITLGGAAIVSLGAITTFIIGLVAQDENENIDIVPDDEGLKSEITGLFGLYQQLGQSADLPVPPKSDDPSQMAAYQQELQEAKRRRRELADHQIELNRLTCHLNENKSYYTQIYWSSVSSAHLEQILQSEFNIPPSFVESKIVGFDGAYAAFKVVNSYWLHMSGIDIVAEMKKIEEKLKSEIENGRETMIRMPTRGMTAEPEFGSCNACDEFVIFHRKQDKAMKLEEVEQTKLETQRLQERLNNQLLGDPTPFDDATSLSVSTTFPNDDIVPASDSVTEDDEN